MASDPQVSSPSNGQGDMTVDPSYGNAWILYCTLVYALEVAIAQGDKNLANQVWIPLQAQNRELLTYWQNTINQLPG